MVARKTGATAMRWPRMTTRRWLIAVAVVAVVLAVRAELERMRQQQVEAEIRQLTQALSDIRAKYPEGFGRLGRIHLETDRQ